MISPAAQRVAAACPLPPVLGIVLGTGLGRLVEDLDIAARLPFADLPGFRTATALGHVGEVICGTLAGVPTIALRGRLHGYEGHSPQEITFPVRVMAEVGVKTLIVSNAAGGLHPQHQVGDLVLIEDHINLQPQQRNREVSARQPDYYSRRLMQAAEKAARAQGVRLSRGTYVAMLGPTYETRAEYRMLRTIGGDLAGMSTVPEVMVAANCGMQVLGFSVVTNVCSPDVLPEADGHAVEQAAARAAKHLRRLLHALAEGGTFANSAPSAKEVS